MNGTTIPNTPIVVDYWKLPAHLMPYKVFFLTHMHVDHTAGLTSSWRYPIYCSELTGKLLKVKFGIREHLIHPLALDEPHLVSLNKDSADSMTVTLINANHCPGSVMFVFEGYFGRIVYTGDFRYSKDVCTSLARVLGGQSTGLLDSDTDSEEILTYVTKPVDILYLDNTFCSPHCDFPTRECAKMQIIDIISRHPDHNVVIGIHSLGKENLLVDLAQHFKTWISVSPKRLEILKELKLPNVFSTELSDGFIRVVPQGQISKRNMQLWNVEARTIGIIASAIFTGLNCQPYVNQDDVFVVPYSDHSSYLELCEFVKCVHPRKILPIVPADTTGPFSTCLADQADMRCFDEYLDTCPSLLFEVPKWLAESKFTSSLISEADISEIIGPLNKRKRSAEIRRAYSLPNATGVLYEDGCDVHDSGCDVHDSGSSKQIKRSRNLSCVEPAISIHNNSQLNQNIDCDCDVKVDRINKYSRDHDVILVDDSPSHDSGGQCADGSETLGCSVNLQSVSLCSENVKRSGMCHGGNRDDNESDGEGQQTCEVVVISDSDSEFDSVVTTGPNETSVGNVGLKRSAANKDGFSTVELPGTDVVSQGDILLERREVQCHSESNSAQTIDRHIESGHNMFLKTFVTKKTVSSNGNASYPFILLKTSQKHNLMEGLRTKKSPQTEECSSLASAFCQKDIFTLIPSDSGSCTKQASDSGPCAQQASDSGFCAQQASDSGSCAQQASDSGSCAQQASVVNKGDQQDVMHCANEMHNLDPCGVGSEGGATNSNVSTVTKDEKRKAWVISKKNWNVNCGESVPIAMATESDNETVRYEFRVVDAAVNESEMVEVQIVEKHSRVQKSTEAGDLSNRKGGVVKSSSPALGEQTSRNAEVNMKSNSNDFAKFHKRLTAIVNQLGHNRKSKSPLISAIKINNQVELKGTSKSKVSSTGCSKENHTIFPADGSVVSLGEGSVVSNQGAVCLTSNKLPHSEMACSSEMGRGSDRGKGVTTRVVVKNEISSAGRMPFLTRNDGPRWSVKSFSGVNRLLSRTATGNTSCEKLKRNAKDLLPDRKMISKCVNNFAKMEDHREGLTEESRSDEDWSDLELIGDVIEKEIRR